MYIKRAIRLPLPHIPVGNNGSGFAYSLAVDASALHQAVQRELLLANIYFSTLARHTTHPSGEMDRFATKDLQRQLTNSRAQCRIRADWEYQKS